MVNPLNLEVTEVIKVDDVLIALEFGKDHKPESIYDSERVYLLDSDGNRLNEVSLMRNDREGYYTVMYHPEELLVYYDSDLEFLLIGFKEEDFSNLPEEEIRSLQYPDDSVAYNIVTGNFICSLRYRKDGQWKPMSKSKIWVR